MRILLTDGAGLTARQVATRLDQMGHEVTAMVSGPICLARFTRHVARLERGPGFGEHPLAWFDALIDCATRTGADVIFPTQEQVSVLSHQLPRLQRLHIATAVPPFHSLLGLQDKVAARATLVELGLTQPRSIVVHTAAQARQWSTFPAYVKIAVATGSTGVVRVDDPDTLNAAVHRWCGPGGVDDVGLVIQEAIDGDFVMAQCVFDSGSLVAFAANERTREGANGSACAKTSIAVLGLRDELERLGDATQWHGALSVDAIVADGCAFIIDVNPRLVEPANAYAAGTDLVAALLGVAVGTVAQPEGPSHQGVRTHQLLLSILGAAQRNGRRRDVASEIVEAMSHRGVYRDSTEELLPMAHDWRTIVPTLAATMATLIQPRWSRIFTNGAVAHYALTAAGWRELCDTQPLSGVNGA